MTQRTATPYRPGLLNAAWAKLLGTAGKANSLALLDSSTLIPPAQIPGTSLITTGPIATELQKRRRISAYEIFVTQSMLDDGTARAQIDLMLASSTSRVNIITGGGQLRIPKSFNRTFNAESFRWYADGTDFILMDDASAMDVNHVYPGFIDLRDCFDVEFSGSATIDYDKIPYTQGVIIATTSTTFDVQVAGGHRTDFTSSDGHFTLDYKGRLSIGVNSTVASKVVLVSPGVLRVDKISFVPQNSTIYAQGNSIALLHQKYGTHLIYGERNTNVVWSGDWKAWTCPGIAVVNFFGMGEQDWRGFSTMRKPGSGRAVAANGGGVAHAEHNGSVLRIGGTVDGCADDCISVSGIEYQIQAINGNTITVGADTSDLRQYSLPFKYVQGAPIAFIAADGSVRGTVSVATAPAWITQGVSWSMTVNAVPAGAAVGERIINTGNQPELTIIGPKAHIGPNWGNGVILRTKNALVDDNLFDGIFYGALMAAPGTSYKEGPAPSRISFCRNRVWDCGRNTAEQTGPTGAVVSVFVNRIDDAATAYTGQAIELVDVSDNDLWKSNQGGIYIASTTKATANNNRFAEMRQSPQSTDPASPANWDIAVRYSPLPVIDGNAYAKGGGKICAIDPIQAYVGNNPGMKTTNLEKIGDFGSGAATGTNAATAFLLSNRSNRINTANGANCGVLLPVILDWGAETITISNIGSVAINIYPNPTRGDYFDLTYPASISLASLTSITLRPSGSGGWVEVK
jgi:hypothetical protein